MAQRSSAATEVARGFWARDVVDVSAPEEVTAEAERIFAQLQAGLARWVGSAGYRTLVDRALELTLPEHPALGKISCDGNGREEIAAAVRAHGPAEVTSAIVALVAMVIVLLGRIVGEEMAVELVKQVGTPSPRRASNNETEGGRDG
jgi:hypothetical protein